MFLQRRHVLSALFASALIGFSGLAAPAAARSAIENEAADFLTNMARQAVTQLTNESEPMAERIKRFRDLMRRSVDMPLMAQQVVGRYWRGATAKERDDFTVALREALIERFSPLFNEYEGEQLEVTRTRTSSQNKNVVGATTRVQAPNGETAEIEWFLVKTGQGMRIYDFSAEGVRLTISLRDEYDSFLRKNGGSLAALTKEIKANLPPTADYTS